MPRVTLVGYRGTGKTTVAAILGSRLGVAWVDADAGLEARAGCPIAVVVGSRGESAFRDLETEVLRDLLSADTGVLATGGGVVLRPENRRLLRDRGRPIVWLQASADVVRRRLASDPSTASRRPALTGRDPLDEVSEALAAREPLYREVAGVAFDTGSAPATEIAGRIMAWLDGEGRTAS